MFGCNLKESFDTMAKPPFSWSRLFGLSRVGEDFFDQVEEALIEGDSGAAVTARVLASLREQIKKEGLKGEAACRTALRVILKSFFPPGELPLTPGVLCAWVFIGVNGVGKTSTIAKLAHYHQTQKNASVLLAAGDTYRAAAREQLQVWADRLKIPLVGAPSGSDAASVAYDGVESALARGCQLALIDTAGRLHTRDQLLEQLGKLVRAVDKFGPTVKRHNLMVLDATQGQAVLDQVRIFRDKVGLSGLILTKTDTQARGGTLLALADTLKVPVLFTTHGEALTDISPFDVETYLDSLL